MPIIEVDHITKEYCLGQHPGAATAAKRLRGTYVEKHKPFTAPNDVSFTLESGEVLGIIDHTGAVEWKGGWGLRRNDHAPEL